MNDERPSLEDEEIDELERHIHGHVGLAVGGCDAHVEDLFRLTAEVRRLRRTPPQPIGSASAAAGGFVSSRHPLPDARVLVPTTPPGPADLDVARAESMADEGGVSTPSIGH